MAKEQCFAYGPVEIEYLKAKDPALGRAMDEIGHIDKPVIPDVFLALVNAIIGQQISTKAQETKVTQINEDFQSVSGKIKKVDRRLDTLNTHLMHSENLKQHRAVYKKYQQLDPKKRGAFLEKHSEEIQSYKSAKQYLDAVMNGKTGLPVKEWTAERDRLTAERFSLCEDYYRLKDETRSVEFLQKGAENILHENGRDEPIATKKRETEL